jgi:hypothetical protein
VAEREAEMRIVEGCRASDDEHERSGSECRWQSVREQTAPNGSYQLIP